MRRNGCVQRLDQSATSRWRTARPTRAVSETSVAGTRDAGALRSRRTALATLGRGCAHPDTINQTPADKVTAVSTSQPVDLTVDPALLDRLE
jgi:hypothetical protein